MNSGRIVADGGTFNAAWLAAEDLEVLVTEAGAAFAAHAGPRAVGAALIRS